MNFVQRLYASMLAPRQRFIVRATFGYALFASAWIFLSDHVLSYFADVSQMSMFATAKGLMFVFVTSVLLFMALQSVPQKGPFEFPKDTLGKIPPYRIILAALLPLLAAWLQWILWVDIQPYAWFLFFPTVFLSSWLGGLIGGICATTLSAVLVWYLFIPYTYSFEFERPQSAVFLGIFFGMGVLFSFMHERLRISERYAADARFRGLFEQTLAGIYILQGERFLYVNQAFAGIFGYSTPADITEKTELSKLISIQGLQQIRDLLANPASHGECIQSACLGLRRDGNYINIEIHGRVVTYGAQPAIIGLIIDITGRMQAEDSLRHSEQLLRAIVEGTSDAVFIKDVNGHYQLFNSAAARYVGHPVSEVLSHDDHAIFPPAVAAYLKKLDREIMAGGVVRTDEEHLVTDKGERLTFLATKGPLFDEHGKITGLFGISRDITALKLNEQRLTQAAAVFETTREGVVVTDAENRIIMVNRAFCQISGYAEQEVLGQSPNILNSGRQDKHFYDEMWASINTLGYWQGEIWNRRKNGEIYPELLSISSVRNEAGNISNYVAVFTDISQIKSSEAKLEFLAHHDALTQLPNRLLFHSRLEHSINQAKRSNSRLALLMLDLDRFKDVNDSFGHLTGDTLLQHVAEHLKGRVREADTVARLGGDEFILLMEGISSPEDAARLSDEIIHAFNTSWTLPNGIELHIGASIGISIYPEHGANADELLQHADAAMYQAKALGRGNFKYFSEDMTRSARDRIEIELGLRHALQNNELRVYYQPQVDILSGRIVGAEALVRWQHPSQGLIPPIRFIPVAETTGLISQLGAWVLRETCMQGQRWIAAGLPPLTLAVNVSPHQFIHSNIEQTVSTILLETGFPPPQLELELTESALMGRDDDVIDMLKRLRALGVRLAIDDFGTGYSSLAYLKSFPLDVLKIDKRFVDDIPAEQDDMEIAATIVAMGHTLGFKVLAEGVEKHEQLDFLLQQGCDMYQGYLTSPPIPAEEFAALITSRSK